MDAATLTRCQPADGTLPSLRTALAAITLEEHGVASRAHAAGERRIAALTGGTAKQVVQAEEDVRLATIEGEQLRTLRAAVEAKLPAARGAELVASVRAQQQRAEAAVAAFREAWPAYREHAQAIAAILQLEVAASSAITELQRTVESMWRMADAADTGQLGTIVVPRLPGVPMAWEPGRSTAANATRLPPAAEGEGYVWATR